VYIPGHLSPFDWQKNLMNDDPNLWEPYDMKLRTIQQNVNFVDEILRISATAHYAGGAPVTSWSAERRSLVENGPGRITAAPSIVSPSFPPVTITLRDGFAL
jgi:hypothetical protein